MKSIPDGWHLIQGHFLHGSIHEREEGLSSVHRNERGFLMERLPFFRFPLFRTERSTSWTVHQRLALV